jgi:hypothetical protein
MPLRGRSTIKVNNFDINVSYRVNEERLRLRDAVNIFSNQGRLDTRFGTSKFNAITLGSSVLSQSFFKTTGDSKKLLAKASTKLYSVAESGAHTELKTGLTSSTVHRAITLNNRHIVAVESDGLFSYDGTTFTQLGQAVPTAPTIVKAAGGSLTDATYEVAVTFYDSTNGFETNIGAASSQATTETTNNTIEVSDIPTVAANGNIDKVRVYFRDASTTPWLFWEEISLGTATSTIDEDATSTQVPPTKNAAPTAGGGRFLTSFNRKFVYSGNPTFKNDVFFSEQDLPDAFDDGSTAIRLFIPGNGAVTGIATGFFNDSLLDPFLVIFKKTSTHIYSEIGGTSRFATISNEVGCVSDQTIIVKNGAVYFLSINGWRVIQNGLFVSKNKNPITLSDGDLDDIFTSPGYIYELNKSDYGAFHSVYYPALDQYLTWVSEGASTGKTKAYVYEFKSSGFKPYNFPVSAISSTMFEDSEGKDIVLFGDASGQIYKHSTGETKNDVDNNGAAVNIDAFALVGWLQGPDADATFNFRELLLRGLADADTLTVKAFFSYNLNDSSEQTYQFVDPESGFVLDISRLDEGIFSDGRTLVTSRADINRTAENIMVGFYQNEADGNIGLIALQLDFSKNGNRNL